MPGYNSDAPTILGPEVPLSQTVDYALNNPGVALAMKIVPGAVSMNEWHSFLSAVVAQPGLALEAVSTLTPTTVSSIYRPGSDSDAITTGFVDQAGGAVNFADVDNRYDAATYARTNVALKTSAYVARLAFSSSASGTLTGERILAVHVGASIALLTGIANTATAIFAQGMLLDNATTAYTGPERTVRRTGRYTVLDRLASFPFDPTTGLPWLVGDFDDWLDPTDNELFGIQLRGQAASTAVRVNEITLEAEHCPENRHWYSYLNRQPEIGWTQQTMTTLLGAFTAATYYWLVISCPWATGGSRATIPLVLADTAKTPLSTSASGAGEHRRIQRLTLGWPAGVAVAAEDEEAGYFPALIGNAAVINAQSQAYAGLDRLVIASNSAANIGQQITTPAGGPHTIAAVKLALGWASSERPDAPLVVEVRSGGGAISGGGTLHGRVTITPAEAPTPITTILKEFDASALLSLANSTQFHVFVRSGASVGRGWVVFRGDSHSDLLQTTPTTTLAEVQQATFGPAAGTGQSDSYVEAGVEYDRYDLMLALVKAPNPPASVAATALAEVGVERGANDLTDPGGLPNRVEIVWTPAGSALGSSFKAVEVVRRRVSIPASPWVTAMRREASSTETAADVEATETRFVDYCAGYTADHPAWDYAVVYESTLGIRSRPVDGAVLGVVVGTVGCNGWVLNNEEPWLNSRLRSIQGVSGGDAATVDERPTLGGGTILRSASDPPPRRYAVDWADLSGDSDRAVRVHRELALSGLTCVLFDDRQNRWVGMPTLAGYRRGIGPRNEYAADFVLGGTDASLIASGPNEPCELVFNGSDVLGLIADHSDLDPGAQAFTVCWHGRLAGSAASDYLLSKGQIGTGQGYGLRTTAVANTIEATLTGASATVSASGARAAAFDGRRHTVWLTYDQATLSLYLDDENAVLGSAAGVAGSISNALALLLGANNNGSNTGAAGSWWSGSARAVGYWPSVLGTTDRAATHRYFAGYYNYRPPTGARVFIDTADTRSWDQSRAELHNLGASLAQHVMALAGSWKRRGRPWRLELLDRLLG